MKELHPKYIKGLSWFFIIFSAVAAVWNLFVNDAPYGWLLSVLFAGGIAYGALFLRMVPDQETKK